MKLDETRKLHFLLDAVAWHLFFYLQWRLLIKANCLLHFLRCQPMFRKARASQCIYQFVLLLSIIHLIKVVSLCFNDLYNPENIQHKKIYICVFVVYFEMIPHTQLCSIKYFFFIAKYSFKYMQYVLFCTKFSPQISLFIARHNKRVVFFTKVYCLWNKPFIFFCLFKLILSLKRWALV